MKCIISLYISKRNCCKKLLIVRLFLTNLLLGLIILVLPYDEKKKLTQNSLCFSSPCVEPVCIQSD